MGPRSRHRLRNWYACLNSSVPFTNRAQEATTELTRFHEVIGLDPSEKMIRAIRANRDFFPNPTPSRSPPVGGIGSHRRSGQKFSFRRGNAEDMARSDILDSSVDLVIAGRSVFFINFFSYIFIYVGFATIPWVMKLGYLCN